VQLSIEPASAETYAQVRSSRYPAPYDFEGAGSQSGSGRSAASAGRSAQASSRDDNGIEANLHFKVCHGVLTLRQAQTAEVVYKHKYA
jgi:hypothetical protein